MPPTSLASLTTLRFGGPIAEPLWLYDPDDWQELVHIIGRRREGSPLTLGHGSNVIASDTGYPGSVTVVNTCGIFAEKQGDGTVLATVQAGHPLTDLVAWAAGESLAGVECLAGIPGTTGAAPVQNTGAYGQQIGDVLDHVTAWDWDLGGLRTLPSQACRLRHRGSRFKNEPDRWTVLTVTLRLTSAPAAPITYRPLAEELGVQPGARPPVAEVAAAVLANRHRRGLLLDPHGSDARQVGSVFLNPPITSAQADRWSATGCPIHTDSDGELRASAGWLLELVGCRPGRKIAQGTRCSSARTLTLTAHEGATATGFVDTLSALASQVERATGISLRPEPVKVGTWAPPHRESV
ncbi:MULTISPECIES: UDP-N-acetylmuramate dehydrogenase [unclassified Streptomyces]|uniref:UDP-N-acetylmuramate dehydrogenase n=1 Tax=unclassified Streptomyces TaxID=2593676 RepID=UPI001660D887|nr:MULTISPECIES: UDP-N-acetylmuramate dehydrogenase [unclassified Streptomyces]MBD0710769.1 UDP-N-acetylenolpyruvoylglucosamine reductase [Streptomyces sp. CBMA291]MBD0718122.1 UDP-N-acetylenolpyruvoylglucosamine reductase [Streptomyces sp. CBMA370]